MCLRDKGIESKTYLSDSRNQYLCIRMASHTSDILLLCRNTLLGEKKEVLLKTTYHPTFKMKVEFGDSRKTQAETCPYCHKKVKYKAYCLNFSLKKALRWPAVLILVSVLLFFVGVLLFIYAGWEIDPVMWYFGLWGISGFFVGVGLLVIQVGRYLVFYTKNKYKCIFAIVGIALMSPGHVLRHGDVKVTWRDPPV